MNNRRKFFKKTIIAASGLLASKSLASNCTITPAQTEGPFYPIDEQLDTDTDLVFVKGSSKKASGEIVYIKGQVLDQFCKPVKNALVEIWQACESGKYNHPNDPNPAKLDRNFQYWGKALSDDLGRYSFRTIIPGSYPATNTWNRPPHVHFKISQRGYEILTTQMYFKGHHLNKNDKILKSLSKSEKENVLVDFEGEKNKKVGIFNITLNQIF